MGRMVYNNLYCLGLLDDARKLLEAKGVDLTMLESSRTTPSAMGPGPPGLPGFLESCRHY